MAQNELTPRQYEILELIRSHIAEEGCPPTRAEISDALGFRSPNAAEEHLRALERKGYLEIVPNSSRGIRLLEEDYGLPVIGRVAAGEPILADQHIEDYCQVDPDTFHPAADYLLRVRGDSMPARRASRGARGKRPDRGRTPRRGSDGQAIPATRVRRAVDAGKPGL
jgi:SOS regulatory protein LexA